MINPTLLIPRARPRVRLVRDKFPGLRPSRTAWILNYGGATLTSALSRRKNMVSVSVNATEAPGAPFDYVLLVCVLETVPNVKETLGRVAGFLKPGGCVYVAGRMDRLSAGDGRRRRVTKGGVARWFDWTGFEMLWGVEIRERKMAYAMARKP